MSEKQIILLSNDEKSIVKMQRSFWCLSKLCLCFAEYKVIMEKCCRVLWCCFSLCNTDDQPLAVFLPFLN